MLLYAVYGVVEKKALNNDGVLMIWPTSVCACVWKERVVSIYLHRLFSPDIP